MDYNNDDNNPFADSSIRQATAASYATQPAFNEYNPFTNTTIPARPAPPPQQPNIPAVLPPTQLPSYTSLPTPYTPQLSTEKYGYDTKPTPAPAPTAARIDLSQIERQQQELEEREKRLAERERAITNTSLAGLRVNNFPPLPTICPCRPCFYQDINIEIPTQFQLWVRYIYYLWLLYSLTLFLNVIAALSYFVVDKAGAATFGLSIVYCVLFIPASYVCWFRPIYRAFREDSASSFMIFFLIFFIQLIITVLQVFGVANLGCGFILMFKLFAAGGSKIGVGLLVMIVTFSFAVIALAGGLLLIQVHRLYRQTGASLEQAQKEFQTAFVNNPTVRGAAREAATAGINDALRSDGSQQKPIY
ncbi:unnamed protein product [Adineta steineri]|uniref:Secretory carrier-associated membrane protein n=1 Tax=Adineta steineri TaxID=433720 RepID=A0A813RVK7_9BILA|nr:unnamed protein product [Adineta steineri]CAF3515965.1 unnamed protein product [Adineta steineri]